MRVSDRDIEDEVLESQSRMGSLARVYSRATSQSVKAFITDIKALMERTGYSAGLDGHAILNLPADGTTVLRLERLLERCPEALRPGLEKALRSRVASHTLTNRSATVLLSRLNAYAVIDDMRRSAARILGDVVRDGYLRATFALQKESGVGWAVDALKGGRVQIIVDTIIPMDQAVRYMDATADMSSKVVMSSLLQGLPPDTVSQSVDDIDRSTIYRSKRASRTAISEAAAEAHMEAYREHEVRRYRFVATWDERTCPVCGDLDGEEFALDDAMAGANYPPMHPNCRCTTVAALSPRIEALMRQRRYTDAATGITHDIPRRYTYTDWWKEYGPGRTDGRAYVPKFHS